MCRRRTLVRGGRATAVAIVLVTLGCKDPPPPVKQSPAAIEADASTPAPDPAATSLVGIWRAVLDSPGGPLPFRLEFDDTDGVLQASAFNGTERVPFSSVERADRQVTLGIDIYDSEIQGKLSADGKTLKGRWTKTTPKGKTRMKFRATFGDGERFVAKLPAVDHAVPERIDGDWAITFSDGGESTFAGRGIFKTVGQSVHGTILTDTGDYRYLEGRYEGGTLQLSCFDGGHAFLFRATVAANGTMAGDFWSRAAYHAKWTAKRMAPGDPDPLADPFAAVSMSPLAKDGRFRFAFPDLSGKQVTDQDERFAGKVVLVDIFGTWCPNCNDYAPLLAEWDRRYRDRGLQIVGLAFEMTGDAKRDREFVARYGKKYGLEFPLLLAGVSDKKKAGGLLTDLSEVASYPTTVFVGRDGRVHKIHSGFAGPATGEHHTQMVAAMEKEIEALLGS